MIPPYAHYLTRAAQRWPAEIAIVDGDTVLCYAELAERVQRLAAGLRSLGLRAGDRVAILQENNHRYVEAVCAVAWAGGTFVPMLGALTPSEHGYILENSEATLLIALTPAGTERARQLLRSPGQCLLIGPGAERDTEALIASHPPAGEPADGDPQALAQILYTSGTTGKPKGVIHSRASTSAGIGAWVTTLGIDRGDCLLGHFALSHFGGRAMDSALCVGATLVILPCPDVAHMLPAIARHRVTVLLMIPTLLQALLDHPEVNAHDLSSLRLVLYAAAPASPTLVRRALQRFGPVLATGFGQTEAYGLATYLSPAELSAALHGDDRRLASIGREATAWVQVRVAGAEDPRPPSDGVGEICICAPWVMQGYWKLPELTRQTLQQGWLYTRDLGRRDAAGYFYLVDRRDDMIITGGFNVYPREVEDVIAAVPGVRECCVIGIPDPKWGEAVHALVVGEGLAAEQILAHCKARLAPFKVPKKVEFVAELPKSSVGKILRRVARAPYWAGRDRAIHGAE